MADSFNFETENSLYTKRMEKEIRILQEQIDKIDSKGFDLESWKIYTINILERIFGPSSDKIAQIRDLKYDFSSWSLRDTSGSTGTIKKKARVILESSINELRNFGLPESVKPSGSDMKELVLDIFSDELKGSQFKRLKDAVHSEHPDVKKEEISRILGEMTDETRSTILLGILMKV